jgi:hypothetical protein
MVSSILLVPSDDYRDALLGPSFPRCPPPSMCRAVQDEPWSPWCGDSETCTRALTLAFQGKVVREGRDRAAYVLSGAVNVVHRELLAWVHLPRIDREDEYFGRAESYYLTDGRHPVHGFDARMVDPRGDVPVPLRVVFGLAVICAKHGLGRVVLLDGDGREVSGG